MNSIKRTYLLMALNNHFRIAPRVLNKFQISRPKIINFLNIFRIFIKFVLKFIEFSEHWSISNIQGSVTEMLGHFSWKKLQSFIGNLLGRYFFEWPRPSRTSYSSCTFGILKLFSQNDTFYLWINLSRP